MSRLREALRFPLSVWAAAVTCPLIWLLSQAYRVSRMPDGLVWTGIVNEDHAVYSAYAGAYLEEGWLLWYPFPFAASFDTPRVYSLLWELLFAGFTAVTGSFAAAWILWQLLIGVACLLVLYRTLRAFGVAQPVLTRLFLWVVFGAGVAWLFAGMAWAIDSVVGRSLIAPLLASDEVPGLRDALRGPSLRPYYDYWRLVEFPQFHWNMNMFRVFSSAADLFNHALFFLTMLLVVRGAYVAGAVLLAITFWAHPSAGVSAVGTICLFAFLEAVWGTRRRGLLLGLGAALVGGLGVGHQLWLGTLPDGISTKIAAELVFHRLGVVGTLASFGPPLAVLAWGLRRRGLAGLVASRPLRLATGWVAAEILLVYGTSALGMERVQPLHYARGFLYTGLALLGVLLLQGQAAPSPDSDAEPANDGSPAEDPPQPRGFPRSARWLIPLGLLLLLVDNGLVLQHHATKPEGFVLTAPQAEVVAALGELESRELVLTVPESTPAALGLAIVVLTQHRSCWSSVPQVHGEAERRELCGRFAQTADPAIPRQLGATLLVVPEPLWRKLGSPPTIGHTTGYRIVRVE